MTEKPKPNTEKESEAIAKAVSTGTASITTELTNFLEDLKKKWIQETQKAFDEQLAKAIEAQKLEINQVMRKTFGMDDNLPVTKGEVVEIIRKAALDASENQKKTPAPDKLEKANPDGTKQIDWVDQTLNLSNIEGGKK